MTSEPTSWLSKASHFLHREVQRNIEEPGLKSLPQGPERDFLLLTWGPVVYRTTYAPDSDRLFPLFLRALNDEVRKSVSKRIDGTPEHIYTMEQSYSSKVISDRNQLDNADEDTVRDAFRVWKRSLGLTRLTSAELPVRLKICLKVDDHCLANFTSVLDQQASEEAEADYSKCQVKVVEDMLAEREQPNYKEPEDYPGWTTITFSSFVEVYDSLHQGKRLSTFYNNGMVYMGRGEWTTG